MPDTKITPPEPSLAHWHRFQQNGSQSDFEALVRHHAGWMLGVATRYLGSDEQAADMVQETFALLLRKRPVFPSEPALISWLHRAILFQSRNAMKKESRRRRLLGNIPLPDAAATVEDLPEEATRALDAALDALSAKDRELLLERYFAGASWEQLASKQGEGSAEAIRKRAERLLGKLRDKLASKGAVSLASLTAVLESASGSPISREAAAAIAQQAAKQAAAATTGGFLLPMLAALVKPALWVLSLATACSLAILAYRLALTSDREKIRTSISRLQSEPKAPAMTPGPRGTTIHGLALLNASAEKPWRFDFDALRTRGSWGIGGDNNYCKLCRDLGIAWEGGEEQSKAAAAFLAWAKPHLGEMHRLIAAAKTGPWDWGLESLDYAEAKPQKDLAKKLENYALLLSWLSQAQALTGQPDAVWHGWQERLVLLERLAEKPSLDAANRAAEALDLIEMEIGYQASRNRLSLDQLKSISAGNLTSLSRLEMTRRGMEAEADFFQRLRAVPGAGRAAYEGMEAERHPPDSDLHVFSRSLAFARKITVTDDLIADRLELREQELRANAARIATGDLHLTPYKDVGSTNLVEHHGFFAFRGDDRREFQASVGQRHSDAIRLHIALLAFQAEQGKHANTLEELSVYFPNGLPINPSTAQPYVLKHTPDGPEIGDGGEYRVRLPN